MELTPFKKIITVRLEDLLRDAAYQRKVRKPRARAIADKFNPEIFDPITVVRRGGKWAVVDGATRSYAAELAGYEEIPATPSCAKTEQAEADLYSTKNSGQKSLTAVELYRADVIAQRPDAVTIQEMLDDIGWTVDQQVKGVAALRAAYNKFGPPPVKRALKVLVQVYQGERRVPSRMIVGTIAFIRYHPDARDAHLTSALEKYRVQIGRNMDARGELGSGSRPQTGSEVICEFYNKGLRTQHLRSTECSTCFIRSVQETVPE